MELEASDEAVAPRRSYRDLIKGLAVAAVIIAIGGMLLWQWPNMVALYRSLPRACGRDRRETAARDRAPEDHRPDRARQPA